MDLKKNFKNRAFKKGTYSVGMMFVVLAIVIIINMIVRTLPATITKIDCSVNKLYTLTDTTTNYLKGLDKDVEIYLLAPVGEESESLYNMLEKYTAWSSHVSFEQIDPNVNPNFVAQYTSGLLATNSVIVVSGDRFKIVDYSSFTTPIFDFDVKQYVTGFDGEGQITSAINYVVSDNLPKMYLLEGHNESPYSDSFAALVNKANIVTDTLNLLMADSVPEDCDILMMNIPTVDISPEEAQKLINYLDKGGSLFLISGNTGKDFENLGLLLEYCGLEIQRGTVVETDSKYYLSANTGIKPARVAHKVSNSLITKGISVYMPNSQGIAIRDDARSTLEITKLLTTSKDSYVRVGTSTLLTMQEDDIPGPVMVGTIIEEYIEGNEKDTKIAVFSSPNLLNETCNTVVSGGNYELAVNTITWMGEFDDNISISPKSTTMQLLTVTQADFYKWMVILVGVVPVVFIGAGFVVWFIRRRK